MNSLALVIVVLLIVCSCVPTHGVYYVKSQDLPSLGCPDQPCLTLDEYLQEAEQYFTTGSSFLFLAGNHTGERALKLTNVSTISLKGNSSSSILCCNGFTIVCENVSNLTIDGLSFVYLSTSGGQCSALQYLNSWNLLFYISGTWRPSTSFSQSS
jgi:hypothetical protein